MGAGKCLCCGNLMQSKALDVEYLCGNCDGYIYREVKSREYNYGPAMVFM